MSLESSSADHSVRIRTESTGNIAERKAIRSVNEAAFGGTEEADLVDGRLRTDLPRESLRRMIEKPVEFRPIPAYKNVLLPSTMGKTSRSENLNFAPIALSDEHYWNVRLFPAVLKVRPQIPEFSFVEPRSEWIFFISLDT